MSASNPLHETLVRSAILAPTPDNNQPWLFESEGDTLRVLIDRRRTLPSDVDGMFDLLGIGAAVENMAIAARQEGLAAQVRVVEPDTASATADDLQAVAELTFSSGESPDPLFANLETRTTNRKFYSKKRPPTETLARMADAAASLAGIHIEWISERNRIGDTARLVAATDLIRFQYEPFHNELFKQLRFSAKEAETTRDGLDLRTLELPPGVGLALGVLRSWSVMRWVHRLGLGPLLTIPSAAAIRSSGAIGVVSAACGSRSAFLDGGRALQRLWLQADREKLSLQPLGSPSIFFAHLKVLEGARLSSRHKSKIGTLIDRFESIVPEAAGRHLLMLVRVGESAPPSCRSLRRPVEAVVRASDDQSQSA